MWRLSKALLITAFLGVINGSHGTQDRAWKDTFESIFELDYLTNFGTLQDLDSVSMGLMISYNRLIQRYENPDLLSMDSVRIISATTGRRLTNEEFRELQFNSASINSAVALITGACGRTRGHRGQIP